MSNTNNNTNYRKRLGPAVLRAMLVQSESETNRARRARGIRELTQAAVYVRNNATRVALEKSANFMIERRRNTKTLHGNDSTEIMHVIKKGANVSVLDPGEVERKFKQFKLTVPLDSSVRYAHALTTLVRHGMILPNSWLNMFEPIVFAYIKHGHLAFTDLMQALVERGVDRSLFIEAAIGIERRPPAAWQRGLEIMRALAPATHNAQHAYYTKILDFMFENLYQLRADEVRDVLDLGARLTPDMLEGYIDVIVGEAHLLHRDVNTAAILGKFWRSGVRLPHTFAQSQYRPGVYQNRAHETLVQHGLLAAPPKPKPNTPSRSSKRARSPTSNSTRSNAANRSNANTSKRRRT